MVAIFNNVDDAFDSDYFDEEIYDLDDLTRHGYLDELIDMMDQVLKSKTGI